MAKKRAEISVPTLATEDEIMQATMAEANVQRFLEGRVIRKIVAVPGKLVNIVCELIKSCFEYTEVRLTLLNPNRTF